MCCCLCRKPSSELLAVAPNWTSQRAARKPVFAQHNTKPTAPYLFDVRERPNAQHYVNCSHGSKGSPTSPDEDIARVHQVALRFPSM